MLDNQSVFGQFATLISDLYQRYELPFYLFDLDALDKRTEWVRANVPARMHLYYSAKANPNLHLIRRIAVNFDGIEVASLGEIAAAVLAGVAPERLVFVGPMKTKQDIAAAARIGVRRIVVESINQIQWIKMLGLTEFKLVLRVNPDVKVGSSSIKMGGQPTQFGIDRSALTTIYKDLRTAPEMRLSGYHIYAGTQIENTEVTLAIIQEMREIYDETPDDLRTNIDFLDFGGGFSFPVDSSPTHYPVETLRGVVDAALADFPEHVMLAFELGRFVVAPTGVFCTRVETLKHSKGRDFAICDGGMNAFSGFSTQSRFKRQNFPCLHIPARRTDGHHIAEFCGDVVGPLCTPADMLASGLALPNLSEGDILAFGNCGAYGLTHAMPLFLSHEAPMEIGISNDFAEPAILRNSTQVVDSLVAQGADLAAVAEVLR